MKQTTAKTERRRLGGWTARAGEGDKAMRLKLYLILVFLFLGAAPGQNEQWNDQIQDLSFLGSGSTTDYKLGPGDLIEISIFGVGEFNQTLRISSSGAVSIPYLGKIRAAGMTGAEFEEKLTKLMDRAELIRDPQVSVFVSEYRSQPVFVLGAVNEPGQYMITHAMNLIDIIAMAGGLDLNRADDHALLQRRVGALVGNSSAQGKSQPQRINLEELFEEGNLALNVPVQGGDVIHVPERNVQLYYVIGEVNQAGAYELQPDQQLLVSQAIAWAGGPMKTAKTSNGMLVRYGQNGEREEFEVDFEGILKGKESDFAIQAEDIIFIPGSNIKTIGYGLLGVIPGTISRSALYPVRRRQY